MKQVKCVLILLLVIIFCRGNGQTSAKAIYFELGGPGIASVNYDMRFSNRNDGAGFRVGIGGFTANDGYEEKTSFLFIPLGVNYLVGKDNKNYFEMGGGVTIVSISNSYNRVDDKFSTTFGHLNFGYRLQPKNGGFLFRADIVPIFNKYGFVPYYAGVSFGYKF